VLSSNAARLTTKQRIFEHLPGSGPLYRTPRCGAITVTISPGGPIHLATFAGDRGGGHEGSDPMGDGDEFVP
jgi:hypothetical protein